MTPPAHLLPLALLACEDLDACEVLEDAILESGWSEWTRVALLFWFDGDVRNWEAYVVERASFPARNLTRTTARAIAAVLLFGEWSTTRWPLVEANEARRWGSEFTRLRADIAEAHARMVADGRAATTVFMHPSDYRALRRELGPRTVFTGSMHQGAPVMRLSLEHGDVRVYIDPYLEPGLLSIGSFNMSREEDTIGDHQTTGEKVFAAAAEAGWAIRGGR